MADNVEALAARLIMAAPGLPYRNAWEIAIDALAGIDAPLAQAETNTPGSVLNVRTYPGTNRDGAPVPISAALADRTPIRVWQARPDQWSAITYDATDGQIGGGWIAAQFYLEILK